MKSTRPLAVVALLLAVSATAVANDSPGDAFVAPNLESITERDVRSDVFFLASDEMAGRETLRPEVDITATYVKSRMERAGLQPAGEDGSWYQAVKLKYRQWQGTPTLSFTRGGEPTTLRHSEDFVSTSGPNAAIDLEEAEIAFAGYAIDEPDRDYNDFTGVDLQGKLALILRYEPTPWRKGGGRNPFSRASYLQTKEKHCRDAGAVGVLMVTGPESLGGNDNRRNLPSPESGEKSPPLSLDLDNEEEQDGALPFFHISVAAADTLLGGAGETSRVQKAFDRGDFSARPDLSDMRIDLRARARLERDTCRNVLGKIEGETDEWIILGAHHDHIGLGYFGARDAATAMGEVHNGADDNASGVSTVLEIAEAFATSGVKPRRSFLFMTFTGEEKGLLGSSWYVRHPVIPHEKVVAMINIDMIGRINDGKIMLQGTACSKMLDRHCRDAAGLFPELDVQFSERLPMPASDHWPFYSRAGIPVFFPFGGTNRQMHTAEDDPETLNYKDLTATIRLLGEVAWRLSEDTGYADYKGPVKDAIGPDGKPRDPGVPAPVDPNEELEEEFAVK